MVLLMDDEDRENEGDLILAGEKVTIKYSNIKDMLNIDDLDLQISDLRGQVKILESEKKGRYIR